MKYCTATFFAFALSSALAFPASAEELLKKTVDISNIDAIELAGPGLLTLSQGDQEGLEIIASSKAMERVEVDARGSTLRLRLKDSGSWGFFKIDHKIHYVLSVKQLKKLRSAGSADIEIETDITGESLEIDRAGSGDIRAKAFHVQAFEMTSAGSGDFMAEAIKASRVELSSAGSGDVHVGDLQVDKAVEVDTAGSGDVAIDSLNANQFEITMGGSGDASVGQGKVDSQRVDIGGSGNYSAARLQSRIAELDLSGAADAKVWVDEQLKVDASGASDVGYYGQPMIDTDTSGASSVTSLGKAPN